VFIAIDTIQIARFRHVKCAGASFFFFVSEDFLLHGSYRMLAIIVRYIISVIYDVFL